jgi:hypothetical protein
MALTRTRAELRTEVMERGDFKSVRHPQAEVDRRLDQGAAKLYRLLATCDPDLYLEYKEITVVSGTDTYAVPSKPGDSYDFWKARGVDVLFNGIWHPMKKFNHAERNQYQDCSTELGTRWRVLGGNLRLRPTPNWGGTVKLWYIPAPWVFENDSATLDGIAGYEEYVILWAVIKGKEKDRYDARDLKEDMMDIEAEIREQATSTDVAEPDRVRDVEAEGQVSGFYRGVPWD